jgi:hypothetical protein
MALASYRLSVPAILVAVVVAGVTACGGGEATTGPTDSSSEVKQTGSPAGLYISGDGGVRLVDSNGSGSHRVDLPTLGMPDRPAVYWILGRGPRLVLYDGAVAYSVDPTQPSSAVRLGPALRAVPADAPNDVWLVAKQDDSHNPDLPLVASEVDVTDGRVIRTAPLPSVHVSLEGASDRGLVLVRDGGVVLIWNPKTRTIVSRIQDSGVDTVHNGLLSWCHFAPGAANELYIRSLDQHRDRLINPPTGSEAFNCGSGAFSPDGTTLAIPAGVPRRGNPSKSDTLLALVNVATGHADLVPNSRAGGAAGLIAWSPNGQSVFRKAGGAISRYRLGTAHAATLDVGRDYFFSVAVLGSGSGERPALASSGSRPITLPRGVRAQLPTGWRLLKKPIGGITEPVQVLAAASYRKSLEKPPGGGCDSTRLPNQRPPAAVLVQVVESTEGGGGSATPNLDNYPARRRPFVLPNTSYEHYTCNGSVYNIAFRDHGRAFQAFVSLDQRRVDPRVRRQAIDLLSSMRFLRHQP